MVGDERSDTRCDKGRKTLREVREDEAGDAMIGFLKRHVWPWAEIERLREDVDFWRQQTKTREKTIDELFDDVFGLRHRLAKYERPRDENGRFTSND